MNTDASNVEDINIPQIIERLSMSCIASSGRWSNIFRNSSFTLFKNDRDLRERFDCVAVSESISSSMTNLSSTGCPYLFPTFHQISTLEKTSCRQCSILSSLVSKRPSQVSLFLVAAHSSSSEILDFQIWFPGLSDAVEASTFGSLALYRETKFIIGFDFAVTLSSPASSCVLFDITSRQLVELKWLMLTNTKDDSIHRV